LLRPKGAHSMATAAPGERVVLQMDARIKQARVGQQGLGMTLARRMRWEMVGVPVAGVGPRTPAHASPRIKNSRAARIVGTRVGYPAKDVRQKVRRVDVRKALQMAGVSEQGGDTCSRFAADATRPTVTEANHTLGARRSGSRSERTRGWARAKHHRRSIRPRGARYVQEL